MKILILALLLFTYSNKNIQALPIDWQGEITFDSHYLNNARLIENTADNSNSDIGSYEISNNSTGDNEASFQSYIFKLNPTIIISDSVIIKSEISNGQARGGRLEMTVLQTLAMKQNQADTIPTFQAERIF